MEENEKEQPDSGANIYHSVTNKHYDYDIDGTRKVVKQTSKEGYIDKNGTPYYKENNYFIDDGGRKHEEEIYVDDKEFVAKQQDNDNIQYFTENKKQINQNAFENKKEKFNKFKKEHGYGDVMELSNTIFSDKELSDTIFSDKELSDTIFSGEANKKMNTFFNNVNDNMNHLFEHNVDNVNDFFSVFKPILNKYQPFGLLPQYENKQKDKITNKNSEYDIKNIDDEIEDNIQENMEEECSHSIKTESPFSKASPYKKANTLSTVQDEKIKKYKKKIYELEKKIAELTQSIKQLKINNKKLLNLNTKSLIRRSKTLP